MEAASCSYPCFHGNKHRIVTTRLHGRRYLKLSRVSVETTIHSHNTFPRHPSLAATPCFHGNSHSQSQHFSAEPATRSYPVFPWKQPSTVTTRFRGNHHSHLHRSAWKHPLIDTIRFHGTAVTAPSSPFAMISPFRDALVAGRHYLAAAVLAVQDCAHRRWPCDACPPKKGLCFPLHTSALAHGKRKSSKSISLD